MCPPSDCDPLYSTKHQIYLCLQAISELKQKLLDYRKQIRRTLSYYSLDYVTVSGAQVYYNTKSCDNCHYYIMCFIVHAPCA